MNETSQNIKKFVKFENDVLDNIESAQLEEGSVGNAPEFNGRKKTTFRSNAYTVYYLSKYDAFFYERRVRFCVLMKTFYFAMQDSQIVKIKYIQ